MNDQPLLVVRDLSISYHASGQATQAVKHLAFSLAQGETVAIVGESGSGKSISFRSLLSLLPVSATVTAERMALEGRDLLSLSPRALRQLRGGRIGMVVQDPKQGLDPLMTIGKQLTEMLRVHGKTPSAGARHRVHELLAEVHIRDPERVATLYPHEVSGGMAQRAMLAMMLSAAPELLIADEATSALDAVVRRHVLDLIDEQVRLRGMGLVLISHDLDLVARYADRVLVMYAGRVVEELPASQLNAAQHPYTRGLLACRPTLDHPGRDLPVLAREAAWLK